MCLCIFTKAHLPKLWEMGSLSKTLLYQNTMPIYIFHGNFKHRDGVLTKSKCPSQQFLAIIVTLVCNCMLYAFEEFEMKFSINWWIFSLYNLEIGIFCSWIIYKLLRLFPSHISKLISYFASKYHISWWLVFWYQLYTMCSTCL